MSEHAAITAIKDAGLAGVVLMAGDARGCTYEKAIGQRDIASGAAMEVDTLFQIASMTKAIVSAAALRLVEQGALTLDGPVSAVLPELANPRVFEGPDEAGQPKFRAARNPVTLRHLLTHTAGFSYEFTSERLNQALGADRGAPATLKSLDHPLMFDPGEAWEYGISTDWVGRALEAATGQTLGDVLAEQILGPLGMADTGFKPSEAQRARRATLYARSESGELTPFPIEFGGGDTAEYESGGGGLYSSAPDYLRFLQLILNDGMHGGHRILSAETMVALGTNQIGALRAGAMSSVVPALAVPFEMFPGMNPGWSLAFLINPETGPNGRSAHSLAWAGIANCHYWIDRARGQAGLFMTQLLPFGDAKTLTAFGAFERFISAQG